MAMRTLSAISSSRLFLTVHTAAAAARGVASFQAKHSSPHSALNLASLGIRAASGDRASATREKKTTFSTVAHAASAAEAVTSVGPTEISLAELKKRGDAYFLTDTRPVILFDGVCNMCNGGVNFMLDNDKEGKLRFAALQGEAGKVLLVKSGRAPDDISSIVLVDKDRSYINSEAILRIGQFLEFPYSPAAFLGLIVPMFLRDAFYRTVADNRYSVFGKTDACRLSDSRFAERFIE